jgi:cytoskeletal protein CcmA (bactofilin family)
MSYTPANSDASTDDAAFVLGDAAPRRSTTIGAGASFRGTVTSEGDIFVAGTIDGEVHTPLRIVVESGGVIRGAVHGGDVIIEGVVEGDINASRSVALAPESDVRGDITTSVLNVDPAATFVGRCFMPTSRDS